MPIPCECCRFWNRHATVRPEQPDAYLSDDGMGECRRRAPQYLPEVDGMAHWPMTYKNEWCGEADPVMK